MTQHIKNCKVSLIFSENLLSPNIFPCHEHPSGWIEWALKQYWQLDVQMWALNLKIKPHRESIKLRLFSWQSLQATSHQHDWRNKRWRKMTCCAAWVGEGDALHGLQYGKSSYYLWPLHAVTPLSPQALFWLAHWRRGSHISHCYLHTAVIILNVPTPSHSFWCSSVFTIRGFAVPCAGRG